MAYNKDIYNHTEQLLLDKAVWKYVFLLDMVNQILDTSIYMKNNRFGRIIVINQLNEETEPTNECFAY